MGKDVIIACDFASAEETFKFLDKFEGKKPFVKIGMELYYAEGPSIVKEIKARGHKIFLDLKLHDIPNTVKKAMQVIGGYGVDMVNVHASGGVEMMKAAKEVTLESEGEKHSVTVSYPDMHYVGFWHAPYPDTPYVCIEPWSSMGSTTPVRAIFEEKEDLMRVAPGETYENHWSIRCNF